MKKLVLALFLLAGISAKSQLVVPRFNFDPLRPLTEYYVSGTEKVVLEFQDSTHTKFITDSIFLSNLNSSVNHGTPGNLLWTTASGLLRISPVSTLPIGWSQLTSVPSTVAGYGILDVYTKTTSDSRYLQSYTETDPLFNTKFSSKTTSDLTEASNLYYTATRFNTAFSGKSTTDLTEGTNLYYTSGRFNTAFGTKSTTDLTEGLNQYFTNTRARAAVTLTTNNTSGVATYAAGLFNIPNYSYAPTIDTISSGARNFNQAYQISTTKYVDLSVSPQITCTLSLAGGQSGQIFLEFSADGSTNWKTCGISAGSNTGSLTIGLNTAQITGSPMTIILLPGYYWRLRTNNVTGSPTYVFNGGFTKTF